MQLDLHEIIDSPGREAPFSYEPDFGDLRFDSVERWTRPFLAEGAVRNRAGVLTLEGRLTGEMECVCARCLKRFPKTIDLPLRALLTESPEDEDEQDPDLFLLSGDYIDLDEVAATCLVLNMEQRFLCSESCRGLCPSCGKNLNDGPCSCSAGQDPRLAVLGQLLEKQK